MPAAIELKEKLPAEACKIDNIGSDRHLPFELVAHKTMRAQAIPKPAFRIGHFLPQNLRLT